MRTIVAGLVVGLAVAALQLYGAIEPVELAVYDRLFEWRGPRPPRTPIVIVAVDEASLTELQQQWPLPRAAHALAISRLAGVKPIAIGVDIIFDRPSGLGLADDTALGDAVQLAGNVVLAAAPGTENTEVEGGVGAQLVFRREVPNLPIPVIRKHAVVAPVTMFPDEDSSIRRAPLRVPLAGKPELAFAAAIYHMAAQAGLPVKPLPSNTNSLLINFRGGPRTFKWVSYYQVYRGGPEIDPAVFKRAIVLIGVTTSLAHDVFPTPFARSGHMPGVEILANAVETLVVGNRIRELSPIAAAGFCLFSALASAYLIARWPRQIPLSVGALLFGGSAAVYAAFALFDVWVRVAGPTLAIALTLVAAALFSHSSRVASRPTPDTAPAGSARSDLDDVERVYPDARRERVRLAVSVLVAVLIVGALAVFLGASFYREAQKYLPGR